MHSSKKQRLGHQRGQLQQSGGDACPTRFSHHPGQQQLCCPCSSVPKASLPQFCCSCPIIKYSKPASKGTESTQDKANVTNTNLMPFLAILVFLTFSRPRCPTFRRKTLQRSPFSVLVHRRRQVQTLCGEAVCFSADPPWMLNNCSAHSSAELGEMAARAMSGWHGNKERKICNLLYC